MFKTLRIVAEDGVAILAEHARQTQEFDWRDTICKIGDSLSCLLCFWLFLSVPLVFLNPARAQTIDVGFPASQCVEIDDPSHRLLVGGHSLGQLNLDLLQVEKLHDFEDLVFSSVARLDAESLALAGTSDISSGFVGVCNPSALPEFAWTVADLEHPIACICIDSRRVIAGNDVGEVAAFDIRDGRELWRRQTHSKLVTCLINFSDDLCISSDWVGKIVLFNPATGVEITDFQQHRDRVVGLLPSIASGTPRLFSASDDGTVRMWYPSQRRLVRFVQLEEPVTALCALSDSRVAVATRDARVHVVDMNTARIVGDQTSGMEYVSGLFPIDEATILAATGKGQLSRIAIE